jgi:hypothetical protein
MATRGRNKTRSNKNTGQLNKKYNPTPKIPNEPSGQLTGYGTKGKKFGFKNVWERGSGSTYGIGSREFNRRVGMPLNTLKNKK